jgi:hypothetical protein
VQAFIFYFIRHHHHWQGYQRHFGPRDNLKHSMKTLIDERRWNTAIKRFFPRGNKTAGEE